MREVSAPGGGHKQDKQYRYRQSEREAEKEERGGGHVGEQLSMQHRVLSRTMTRGPVTSRLTIAAEDPALFHVDQVGYRRREAVGALVLPPE